MPLDAAWSDGETFNGAFFSSLVASANASEAALVNKQASDGDLTAIAALTPTNDDVLQRKAGAWTNRTIAQLKSDLGTFNQDTTGSATKWNGYTISGTPTAGQVPTFVSGVAMTFQTPPTGGGGGLSFTDNGDGTGELTGGTFVDNGDGTATV